MVYLLYEGKSGQLGNQHFTEYAPMPFSSNPVTKCRVVSKQGSSKQDGGAMARTVEAGRVSPLITLPGYQSLQVIISLPSSGAPRQPPPSMSSSAGYYAGTNWGTGGEIINEDRTKL